MTKTKEDDVIEAIRNESIKRELKILKGNNLKLGHLGLAEDTETLQRLFDRLYAPKIREAIRLTTKGIFEDLEKERFCLKEHKCDEEQIGCSLVIGESAFDDAKEEWLDESGEK